MKQRAGGSLVASLTKTSLFTSRQTIQEITSLIRLSQTAIEFFLVEKLLCIVQDTVLDAFREDEGFPGSSRFRFHFLPCPISSSTLTRGVDGLPVGISREISKTSGFDEILK